jgi:hypothetical protein
MSNKAVLSRASVLAGLALAALASAPALASGFGEESSLPFMDSIVDWIGFRELTGDRRDLFAYCLVFFAFAFGYLTDLVFRDRGFGKALNGVVGVAGICLALHVIAPYASTFADSSETLRFNLMLIGAGVGSAVTLLVASAFKGVFMRSLRLNLDRLDRAPPPKPLSTEAPLSPRVASALREKA